MKDPTRTSCFPFLVKLLSSRIPFLTRTAGYANQHVGGGSAMAGRRGWSRMLDDGAFFLERSGGAVAQWFLDNGLMQDFGILDMNGIRAAYRAAKTPPPFCLGGPPVLIPPATDEREDVAPERPYVCPQCNDAFETLRQLVAHQTHKHGYRHPPGIVTVTNTCVWCRIIYRGRRATYLHHQQSWKRGYCREGIVVCTPWSYPSILHALTVINISNQSPCCLNTCESCFRWTGEM